MALRLGFLKIIYSGWVKNETEKTKLVLQSLPYVWPNTCNSLPGNLKYATSVNSFKHTKEYFLQKVDNIEADIYSYTYIDPKMKFVTFIEFMQNSISVISNTFNLSSVWFLFY